MVSTLDKAATSATSTHLIKLHTSRAIHIKDVKDLVDLHSIQIRCSREKGCELNIIETAATAVEKLVHLKHHLGSAAGKEAWSG